MLLAKAPTLSESELYTPPPRIIRTCCSFGTDLGMAGIPFLKRTDITSIQSIGKHSFLGNKLEGNGIIYTRKGGFIDIGHLRDCADWTAYLFKVIEFGIEMEKNMLVALGNEGGNKLLQLKQLKILSTEDVYQLSGKIAYDLSLWHEIATWFGASYIPFVPERYSSFSPEDMYSNLLGIQIGIEALKSPLDYEEAMTEIMLKKLTELEAVSTREDTYNAMKQVENVWWTGYKKLPSKKVLLKRYINANELEYLLPWLITQTDNATPYKLFKPFIEKEGVYKLEIKLNRKFPLKAILKQRKDRVITQEDFLSFINYIEQDVVFSQYKTYAKVQKITARKQKRKKNKSNGTM